MGATLLIIGLVLIGLIILFKFKEIQHKIHLTLIAGFLLFAVGSILAVYKSHSIDLTTFEGFLSLGKFYVLWLKQLGHNVVDITGYVVHQDWVSNVTNITK